MCQLLDAAGVGSLFRHDELGASSLDSTVDFKALKVRISSTRLFLCKLQSFILQPNPCLDKEGII